MPYVIIGILIAICLTRVINASVCGNLKVNPYLDGILFSIVGSIGYQSTYYLSVKELFINQGKSILILAALLYLVYLLIYSISSSYLVQVYFTIIVSIGIIANKMKVTSRGEIILWSDFKTGLVKDVVWNMVLEKYWWLVLILLLALIIASYLIITKLPHQISLKSRLINFTLAVITLSLFIAMPSTILTKMGTVIYPNNDEENLKVNGPGLMFFVSKEGTIMSEPRNYSKKTMEDISKKIDSTYSKEQESKEKPTFIYILSEAFYDPTKFEGTQWKEDPIPTIRSLQEESGGYMLADVFGGGTANTEYSILSNFSHNLLNAGALPYSYIYENPKRNSSELNFFKQLGYKTSAVHPFHGNSYNRTDVFKSLGFDNFTTLDDMKDKIFSEGWTSDRTFFNEIDQQLTENPQFIHGISMQNHFDYTVERKGALQEKDNLLLNKESIPSGEQLALFARGMKKTDEALKIFLNKLKETEKEIYVVFYGDHLPALDNALYDNTKLTTNKDPEIAKYMTPYFIWNNKGKQLETPTIVNPEFMTLPALVESGINLPAFYLFAEDMSKQFAAFNKKNETYIADGKELKELSPEMEEMFKEYQLIMYDMLSGNKYAQNIFDVKGEK